MSVHVFWIFFNIYDNYFSLKHFQVGRCTGRCIGIVIWVSKQQAGLAIYFRLIEIIQYQNLIKNNFHFHLIFSNAKSINIGFTAMHLRLCRLAKDDEKHYKSPQYGLHCLVHSQYIVFQKTFPSNNNCNTQLA